MHALGCGRTPFILFVTCGFDELCARLCVLGRPNLTTDFQDHLFRFFWLLYVLWTTIQQQDAIFSEYNYPQSTFASPQKRRAFEKHGKLTNDGEQRRACLGGWVARQRTERGERTETEELQRNVIFIFFCPVSLASFQAFLSGRFSTSSAPVPTDGPRMVRLETGKPCVLCLSEALPLNGCPAGEWLRVDEDLVEQYPDDEAGPPDVPPSLPCWFVDSPCLPFQPSTYKIRAGEVANPHGLPSKIGQSAAAARL